MFAFAPPTLPVSPSLPPTPTPVPPAGCAPGTNAIPHGWLGRLMCGDLLPQHIGEHWTLKQVALTYGPYVLATLAALVAVRQGWAWAKRSAWRRTAASARWLEIVPPVTATPAATVALWRLLATILKAPGRFTLRPARLVWEVHATGEQMRCGIWVPPGINPTAVIRVVQRAWPGARIGESALPRLPHDRPTVGLRLAPMGPDWLPLLDADVLAPTASRFVLSRSTLDAQDDRLRAVYGGLAAAGRTGEGLLQVVVGRAPAARLALARKATTDPAAARRAGKARAAGLLLRLMQAVLRMILDLIQSVLSTGKGSSSSRTSTTSGAPRPEDREEARAARAKYAAGPHLLVGVRVVTTAATRAAARAAGADVTAGFALLSTCLGRRRLLRPATAAAWRSAPDKQLMLASVAEAAALAGVPVEPAAYGLPGAAARRRGPGRDTWRDTGPAEQ